ncbi:hypothetical protein OG884_04070 [Streptosporangium sp. NBC_01755]|uniref:hypothetical protein n=1 Tax=Streptosporangium sp. NBC_01755 TaxID=2975949 RepID=UPI002DDBEDFB|nr:hypothetical protein [Streptosporangium sp. NBC_01755]WSD01123.1 hypothetical protein OG884_04070 [Streptosporangium sp. NBC_01755]
MDQAGRGTAVSDRQFQGIQHDRQEGRSSGAVASLPWLEGQAFNLRSAAEVGFDVAQGLLREYKLG